MSEVRFSVREVERIGQELRGSVRAALEYFAIPVPVRLSTLFQVSVRWMSGVRTDNVAWALVQEMGCVEQGPDGWFHSSAAGLELLHQLVEQTGGDEP